MIRPLLAPAIFLSAALAADAFAQRGYPNLGRDLAAGCASCHETGRTIQAGIPRLAGQPRMRLVQQMQDFKSGRRPASVMRQIAKGYSDEQIEALAAYLSERQ